MTQMMRIYTDYDIANKLISHIINFYSFIICVNPHHLRHLRSFVLLLNDSTSVSRSVA